MAYADIIRSTIATWEDVADLIEGIASSSHSLVFSTWAPSYGAGGSMTYTSVTTTWARYVQIGKLLIGSISATGTTGGSASAYLTFTLPATAAALAGQNCRCYIFDSSETDGAVYIQSSSTEVRVYKTGSANYGLGASRAFSANFFCEVA